MTESDCRIMGHAKEELLDQKRCVSRLKLMNKAASVSEFRIDGFEASLSAAVSVGWCLSLTEELKQTCFVL